MTVWSSRPTKKFTQRTGESAEDPHTMIPELPNLRFPAAAVQRIVRSALGPKTQKNAPQDRMESQFDSTRQAAEPLPRELALLAKHGLDPSKIRIVSSDGTGIEGLGVSKVELLARVAEAHEHARKNRALGNISGAQVSANLMLRDGTWGLGTNIEKAREVALCGERSAVVTAWNRALEELPLEELESKSADLDRHRDGMKIEALIMSGPAPLDEPYNIEPCAECQNWMATERYFSPETKLITLTRDDEGQILKVRRLRDLIPLHGVVCPAHVDKAIARLPVDVSSHAREAMEEKGLSQGDIVSLVERARQRAHSVASAEYSGKFDAAATRMSNGEVFDGTRTDWTARWFNPADLSAAAQGVAAMREANLQARVDAVAYYGESLPSVESLGVIGQETRGGRDTLIATVENERVQIRCVSDYMPYMYVSLSAVELARRSDRVAELVRGLVGDRKVASAATRVDTSGVEGSRVEFGAGRLSDALTRGRATIAVPSSAELGSLSAGDQVSCAFPELDAKGTLTMRVRNNPTDYFVEDAPQKLIEASGFSDIEAWKSQLPPSCHRVVELQLELESVRLA
ncbi:MAG: hypothetical protein AAFV36_00005 [Myxococcota bacterium]